MTGFFSHSKSPSWLHSLARTMRSLFVLNMRFIIGHALTIILWFLRGLVGCAPVHFLRLTGRDLSSGPRWKTVAAGHLMLGYHVEFGPFGVSSSASWMTNQQHTLLLLVTSQATRLTSGGHAPFLLPFFPFPPLPFFPILPFPSSSQRGASSSG